MDLGLRGLSQVLDQESRGPVRQLFRRRVHAEGIRILASPPRAPRANAICEGIIGTLRRELLDRVLIINEHHLRRALAEYLRHYNAARPHRYPASSPRLRLTPGRLNRSTSPSSGSAGSRCSADSPTSTTSPPDCPQGAPNRVSEPHRVMLVEYLALSRLIGALTSWPGCQVSIAIGAAVVLAAPFTLINPERISTTCLPLRSSRCGSAS
jgi:Integrase core domain